MALVAQVAVAINGEYPPGMFDFVTGVLRWGTRVGAFILSLDDRYPPFTLQPVDDYPVDVVVQRPVQSSRLYALFTVIVELIFLAGAITLAAFLDPPRGAHAALLQLLVQRRDRLAPAPDRRAATLHRALLLGIAVFVLWVVVQWVILFSARFPRGMFDFVAGFVRWEARVNGYALGLSDRYPPFTFEPSLTATGSPLSPTPLRPRPLPPAQWYADPSGRHTYRYWDGAQWTPQVADDGRTSEDPLDAPGSG